MTLKLVILFAALLLLIPISSAAYDVVSNISSNGTEYTTSATYGELHNISLATGAGTTFLTASWDARVNFTAPLYGRFLRDGVSFGRFNLTQNVYATVGSYQISFAETTGTHYYGWEVYSNKKGTIYSRNFSAFFLVNGSFSAASYNATYDAYQALISALQNNDTVDRVYVNDTFLPIATYSGNFPNNTVAANLVNWNATYNATYNAKTTLTEVNASALLAGTSQVTGLDSALSGKEGTITGSTGNVFWNGLKAWVALEIGNITSLQTVLNSMNLSSAANDTASRGRDDAQNISIDANTNTIAGNLAAWNATWNATYDATTTTVNGNLANWNATYNSSYAYGGFDILFSNGTNNISVGTKAHVQTKYAGTLTDLTARSVETGSINISAYNLTLGTYIGSVVITAGTDGSTTGLSYVFAKGDWLNLTVSSVTGIKQVTAAVQTVRS